MSQSKTKKRKTTLKVDHAALDPYYLIVSEDQFAVHKHIPSGHQLQAKAYCSNLSSAITKIAHLKGINESIDAGGDSMDLEEFIKIYVGILEDIRDQFKTIESIVNAAISTKGGDDN